MNAICTYLWVGENAKEWKFVVITVNCCFRGRLSRKMSSRKLEKRTWTINFMHPHALSRLSDCRIKNQNHKIDIIQKHPFIPLFITLFIYTHFLYSMTMAKREVKFGKFACRSYQYQYCVYSMFSWAQKRKSSLSSSVWASSYNFLHCHCILAWFNSLTNNNNKWW